MPAELDESNWITGLALVFSICGFGLGKWEEVGSRRGWFGEGVAFCQGSVPASVTVLGGVGFVSVDLEKF